uniref:Uncharacterized protein n=1 Tax=Romanomermis culicivorax TaxID=13658 RepID=A0A915L313_ROMCU
MKPKTPLFRDSDDDEPRGRRIGVAGSVKSGVDHQPGVNFNSKDYCVHGAKYTSGYEDFVHRIFTPGDERRPTDPSFILNYSFPSNALPNANLSASLQLKLESYGSDPLADTMFLSSTLGGAGGGVKFGDGTAAAMRDTQMGMESRPKGPKYPLLGERRRSEWELVEVLTSFYRALIFV